MADETPKPAPSLTDAANGSFQITIGDASNSNVPATTGPTSVATSDASAGGLSYKTANTDERAKMDQIIAGIDLTKSDTIIALGAQERQKLADLADKVLDSVQPDAKLAFAEALKELIDCLKANSLDEIKKRIQSGGMKNALHKLGESLWHHDPLADSKEMIQKFMTDITSSRKVIHEMTDKLLVQKDELDKNFERINALGFSITQAAQDMRIVRAASAEFIERVNDGRITTLSDLQKKANETQRSDDMEKYQDAQTNWNSLRVVDGDLLGSIGVYNMNVANLAFTKKANQQNRIQTATTLTTTIAEWKTQLAIFAVVATESTAAALLNTASDLTAKSVAANKDLFDTLVDMEVGRSAKGTFNLRQIIDTQTAMAAKLEGVGATVEAQFDQLAKDKTALEQSSAEFRKRVTNVYTKGNVLGTATPAPKAPGA
jgi:uncharacterized protein YaaN involved in tellurite resistance